MNIDETTTKATMTKTGTSVSPAPPGGRVMNNRGAMNHAFPRKRRIG
jgi:hypothetical protein